MHYYNFSARARENAQAHPRRRARKKTHAASARKPPTRMSSVAAS
jgi:hypothetical protein